MPNKTSKKSKGKKNFKGKGYQSKPKQGSKDFNETGDPRDGFNDISWWNKNGQLMKDAASVAFAQIAGLPVDLHPSNLLEGMTYKSSAIPGIAKITFAPVFGVSKDGNSPLNNASRLIYAYNRHANSGSRNYEQSDYFTYILAVSNLYVAHAELTRLYGIAQRYAVMNRYIGKALIENLGYNFDNVTNNLASLRYGINELAVRINSFAIPKQMSIITRHIMMAQGLFRDSQNAKAGIYALQADRYYQWSNVLPSGDPGSSLKPIAAPTYNTYGTVTVDTALSFVSNLIDALAVFEDVGLMSGDTLKYAGADGILGIAAIPENYISEPIYDEVMLSQIHNADYVNFGVDQEDSSQWIYQENNNIIYDPDLDLSTSSGFFATTFDKYLDSGMELPTPEFVMEATRLKLAYNNGKLESCGSEILTGITIITIDGAAYARNDISQCIPVDAAGAPTSVIVSIADQITFDWFPIRYLGYSYDNVTAYIKPLGEMFNYTTINNTQISRLHNVALLSALDVYGLSNFNAK